MRFLDSNEKQVAKLLPLVAQVNEWDQKFKELSAEQLALKTVEFRERVQQGESLDDLLPEAFAAVKSACRLLVGKRWAAGGIEQTWEMVPFDVQIIGGIVLHQGKIAEMKTGEGKTLVASMPLYLNSLSGKGAHLVTVNDYLARRDSEWMGEIYKVLGLTVGCVQHGLTEIERQAAYGSDITYGTNNEFGFDYLRDNMVPDLKYCVQRELNYAIVDEVDSILIDEARTPLIISGQGEDSTSWYEKFARLMPKLEVVTDYEVDEKMHSAALTESGIAKVEKWTGIENLYDASMPLAHYLESALKAYALYKIDKDYVIKEGEVVIVDEFTGRLMVGRRYSEGLHQAIEAKEGVAIKKESQTLATITFQNYFRMYGKLAGMTGTAATEAEEFDKIYSLDVMVIPTNREAIRVDHHDYVYKNQKAKFRALVEDVKERNKRGQPVLVGTIAVENSEVLSQLFTQAGIRHAVLNAKQHDREALVVAEAGKKGSVTIATNMAGRGTDIKLGGTDATVDEKLEILSLGGLAVIGSERHESRRIDNQLRGRSGRQGEKGESRFYVALDDDLMRIFGGERVSGLMDRLGIDEDMPIEHGLVSRSIESAQKKVEGYNFDTRKHLVEYDDVMNRQREVVYGLRRQILMKAGEKTEPSPASDSVPPIEEETSPAEQIDAFSEQMGKGQFSDFLHVVTHQKDLQHIIRFLLWREIEGIVSNHVQMFTGGEWDSSELLKEFHTIIPYDVASLERIKTEVQLHKEVAEISEKFYSIALSALKSKEVELSPEIMRQAERVVLLRTIDRLWVNHLDVMGDLREGIGLQGYGQKDPLIEYKAQGFRMFQELMAVIQSNVVKTIYRIGLKTSGQTSQTAAYRNVTEQKAELKSGFADVRSAKSGKEGTRQPVKNTETVGRNDPCPCGSGRKYKKCHGANQSG